MGKVGHEISIADETKIVALVARGDTYEEIKAEMGSPGMADKTIANIKRRNKENLEILTAAMQQQAMDDAMANKRKANKMISKKLDEAAKGVDDDEVQQARKDWIAGDMTWKEYSRILDRNRGLSVGELVGISKEMHNQSKEAPAEALPQQDLSALIEAIRNNDEVKIQQIIFSNHAQPQPTTTKSV